MSTFLTFVCAVCGDRYGVLVKLEDPDLGPTCATCFRYTRHVETLVSRSTAGRVSGCRPTVNRIQKPDTP